MQKGYQLVTKEQLERYLRRISNEAIVRTNNTSAMQD